jgi:hypothetical protein
MSGKRLARAARRHTPAARSWGVRPSYAEIPKRDVTFNDGDGDTAGAAPFTRTEAPEPWSGTLAPDQRLACVTRLCRT